MTVLTRFRDWWVGQFQGAGRLGKVAMIVVPALFACCGLTMCSTLLSPPEAEPTAVVVERAGATVEVASTRGVEEEVEPRATAAPSRTAAPTATVEAETATPRPSATVVAPSATAVPATATRVPPTDVPPTRTAAPPTATSAPPTAAPTLVLPTAVPPTAVLPTAVPPTPLPPTAPPQPTATLPAAAGVLRIIGVDKGAEVVTIRNDGGAPVDLAGWVLRSEKGSQDCSLGGTIGPGQSLQIWAMGADAGRGGFNCGFGSNIWNNSESDPAVLINPSGAEVSRW